TGKGIEKGNIEKLFEKFYQVDDYMTRTHRGTGLGLTIVKRLVELHKGTISVESQIGQGSKFTVILPIEPSKA
ncbi:MAG: ATP-binding protein, partial [Nanoarchaeota archaeon]